MTPSEQSNSYEERVQEVLAAIPPHGDVSVSWLAERLAGTSHEMRAKLVELRRRGLVAYEPGYRTWCRP